MSLSLPGFRRSRPRSWSATFFLTALVLVLCFILGGASRENVIQVCILEIASLPLLGWTLWRSIERGDLGEIRVPLILIGLAAAIPIIQLIPLPFGLWSQLPGHRAAADAVRLMGTESQWRPISLAPYQTTMLALALIPPVAIFLGARGLSNHERQGLMWIVVVAALVSFSIGVLQVTGGPQSPLYFYANTNLGSSVGLFSNRNHQAALFVTCLPFAASLASPRTSGRSYRIIVSTVAVSLLVLMVLGLAVVRSRAGILLIAPAVAGSLLLAWRTWPPQTRKRVLIPGLAAGLVIAIAGGLFLAKPLMERFAADTAEKRLAATPATLEAGVRHLPFGSGIGSFDQVYEAIEPVEDMGSSFLNHAHDDYAEIWLEAGLLGAGGLALFLAWWLTGAIRVWRIEGKTAQAGRAGMIASGLLLIHSAVDYPLRSLAMAGVFAISLAFMAAARRKPTPGEALPAGDAS